MEDTFLMMILALLEGIGLILSPCILPILPIILSGSLEAGNKRPYGIILGFILTFTLFTFFSRELVQYAGIDPTLIRNISFALLILFGVIMLSEFLTEKFSLLTQRFSQIGGHQLKGGFGSGILFGALVGLIWTPCAGPILAAVIVQIVLQQSTLNSFFIVLFFGLGAGIPMLCIALFGRTLMTHLTIFKQHAILVRKILGVIIIGSVIWMAASYGLPNYTSPSSTHQTQSAGLINGITPYPAPPIEGITAWINSPPLQINQLNNKVILIDFWAYSCINCIRTLPYLKNWYAKYHDQGLVIIGIHAPEFEFERDYNNVKNSVEKNGITYPVALDNQFQTWRNYYNRYWPAQYLIDKKGEVVYEHVGEGDDDIIEHNIRFLLGLNPTIQKSQEEQTVLLNQETPETYLGYARAYAFSSTETMQHDQSFYYHFPTVLNENHWALEGKWNVMAERILSSENNAVIKIHFHAKHVYAVMGSVTGKPIQIKLLLNGESVINEKGKDVINSVVTVSQHKLYELIDLSTSESGLLQLMASGPGLEMYTFTFGES